MAKLLVVDDDTIIQKIMQQRLQGQGHQVLLARNGDEGVKLARSERPDLIIIDLWMPVLNGSVATRKIKQFLDIPVIGMTGDDSVEAMQMMMGAGCVEVVYKPVDFISLDAKINALIYPSMIRPRVICIFRHQGNILVRKHKNPKVQAPFYRPIWGNIKFGEYSRDAILREVWQQFGTSVVNLRYLATLEDILRFNERASHEIVQVYEGEFVNKNLYQSFTLPNMEDNWELFSVAWKPFADFSGKNAPLLSPDGLLEVLQLQLRRSGSAQRDS